MATRVSVALLLAAACATAVAGATAAPSALPQQSGVVDLLTQANVRIDGAAADDTFSHAFRVSDAGDVNGDGRDDVLVGALGASNNGRHRSGSAYVVFGRVTTTNVDLAALGDGGFRIDGAVAEGHAGSGVSGAGDVNGDGRADVVVGAPAVANEGHQNAGSAYVVFGKASTTPVDLAALGNGGFVIEGRGPQSFTGSAVSAAGDVNGDGRADVIVGAGGSSVGGFQSGAAYVVFGKTSTAKVSIPAIGANGFQIVGAAQADNAGFAVSHAGDVNSDGRADVIVGAVDAANNARFGSGSAYVVFGKASTTEVQLATLGAGGFRMDGVAPGDHAGDAVSGAGDVNGDGRADVLVGATDAGTDDAGAAYVVFGRTSTASVDLAALGDDGFRIDGADAQDYAGDAVSGVGDVNGDGRPDVLVGAAFAEDARPTSGSAYVVFGKASAAPVDLGALGAGGYRIEGAAPDDYAGHGVSGGGDVNGDGRPDVLVSAIGADNNGRDVSGSVYVLYGFGEPRLTYDPLQAKVGQALKPHAPALFERTGRPSFQVTPPLPAGLSLGGLGAVLGTPRGAPGQTTHTVTMQDLVGQVSASLSVTITADTTAPRMTIRAASPQRALRQKRILVRVSCDEPCTLKAQGAIVVRGISALVPLRPASATRVTAAQRTLALGLTKAAQKRLSRFLAQGRRARAVVSVRSRDLAGNARSTSRGITVRR